MRKSVSLLLASATLLFASLAASCNGSNAGPGIRVALQSNAASASRGVTNIDQGQAVAITATIANDTTNQGVTWNLSGPGSLSNREATSVTYKAPATLSSRADAKITATSVAQPSATAQIVVGIFPPPQVMTTSLPSATVGNKYSIALQVNDGTGPYVWSVSGGGLPSWARFDPNAGVISGTPEATGTANFTVTVKDAAGVSSAPQSLSLVVAQPRPSINTKSLPDGTVGVPYASEIQAYNGVPPYRWSVSSGSLPSWASLDPVSGVISGEPDSDSVTSFTVEVSDSQSTPASDTQDFTISTRVADSVNNAELNGHYAFLLQGFDDATGNQFAAVGSFLADGNGKIAAGVEDVNGPGGYRPSASFTGIYSLGSDKRGYATFTSSSGDRTTFAFAVGGLNASHVATKVSLIEFDDMNGTTGKQGSGSARLQDTGAFDLAGLKGPYAFQIAGQAAQPGSRAVVTGAFVSDGKGNLTSGNEEVNDNGKTQERSFTGTLSSSSQTTSFGRVTLQGLAGSDTSRSVGYIVDSGQMLAMTTGEESSTGLLSGKTLVRSTGSFSSASLAGASVGYSVGLESVSIGRFTFDGMNNGSYTYFDGNANGIVYGGEYPFSTTFSYMVSANGRVTETGPGWLDGAVFYLTDSNEGFWMGTGNSVAAGFFEPQTGTFAENPTFPGDLLVSTVAPAAAGSQVFAGMVTTSGSDTSNLTVDTLTPTVNTSDSTRLLSVDQGESQEFLINPEGFGIGGEVVPSFLLMISSTKAVVIWERWTWPTITIIEK